MSNAIDYKHNGSSPARGRATWLARVVTLGLAACALPVEDGAQHEGIGDPVLQALGSTTTVKTVTATRLLTIGPTSAAVFEVDQGEFCQPPETMRIVGFNGAVADSVLQCAQIGAAGLDGIAIVSNTVPDDIILPFASGGLWLADTNGDTKGIMLVDSTHAYWTDSSGIRKVPRGGGSRTTLVSGSNVELLAREGSRLFFKQTSSGITQLRRIQTDGTQNNSIFSMITGTPAFQDLSFDSNSFFWVDNSQSEHRVHRLPKAGGSSTVLVSSTTDTFRFPKSNGTNLYFLQQGSTRRIRRRAADGTLSNEKTNLPAVHGLALTSTDLFWVETASSSTMALKKAALP